MKKRREKRREKRERRERWVSDYQRAKTRGPKWTHCCCGQFEWQEVKPKPQQSTQAHTCPCSWQNDYPE